ncbi:hypothetical protein [Kitasatospora sp. NPDC005856]|uniref:hypothetical protein n=1 Tax=Kitasatospora sp. NPDC005856 TaxID=3154566 RepID=UPI0033DC3B3E
MAALGGAVLNGCAVLDVLAWDESVTPRRPAGVRAALICADYDVGMHGWRAHADNRDLRVALGQPVHHSLEPHHQPSARHLTSRPRPDEDQNGGHQHYPEPWNPS